MMSASVSSNGGSATLRVWIGVIDMLCGRYPCAANPRGKRDENQPRRYVSKHIRGHEAIRTYLEHPSLLFTLQWSRSQGVPGVCLQSRSPIRAALLSAQISVVGSDQARGCKEGAMSMMSFSSLAARMASNMH